MLAPHKLLLQIWQALLHIHKYALGLSRKGERRFVNQTSNCLLKMDHICTFTLQHGQSEECPLGNDSNIFLDLDFPFLALL